MGRWTGDPHKIASRRTAALTASIACPSDLQKTAKQRALSPAGCQLGGALAGAVACPAPTVALVVKQMAGAAQHHDVTGELSAKAIVCPVMDIEVLDVTDIQGAAVPGAEQRGRAGPSPLRRSQKGLVGHRAQLREPLFVDRWRKRRWRRLTRGSRQPPDSPPGVLQQPIVLQVGQRPRQPVVDRSLVLAHRCRWGGRLKLAPAEASIGKSLGANVLPGRLTAKGAEGIERRCPGLPAQLPPLGLIQI